MLILSKSKFFSEALKFILHDLAEEVEVAGSWEEFRDLLKKKNHDIVVCDMSCVEDYAEKSVDNVKSLSPASKVLVFSFDPPGKHREFIRRIGADGYINRPLNPETVLDSVRALVDNSS